MAKAAKKNQTRNGGSSNRKGRNGNGGNGKAEAEKAAKKPTKQVSKPSGATEETTEAPAEKKRRGRAPTEGEPLKRVLIFLSESDVAALKNEVGDRGMSTRIREILKEYLAKRA